MDFWSPSAFFAFIVVIYAATLLVLDRIFSFSRKKRKLLSQPLHYTVYSCQKGHYLGSKEPVQGELCPICIDKGLITATCEEGGSPHPATYSRRIPPYRIRCNTHGEFSDLLFYLKELKVSQSESGDLLLHVEERQVCEEEWYRYHHYDPVVVPLPVSDPIPDEVLRELDADNQIFTLVDPQQIRDRWRTLLAQLEERIKELERDIERRQSLQRQGLPIGIILCVLLLLITLLSQVNQSSSPFLFDVALALQQIEQAATALLLSCMIAASLAVVIIVIIKRRKQPGENIDWFDVAGSTSFALLAELAASKYFLKEPLTIFDLLKAITLETIPTITFAFIYNRKHLEKSKALLGEQQKLRTHIRNLTRWLHEKNPQAW
jgi:hypothetical protein